MLPETSKLVDVRTSRVEDHVAAINDFVEAGYEVNVNFGPVILREGWVSDTLASSGCSTPRSRRRRRRSWRRR